MPFAHRLRKCGLQHPETLCRQRELSLPFQGSWRVLGRFSVDGRLNAIGQFDPIPCLSVASGSAFGRGDCRPARNRFPGFGNGSLPKASVASGKWLRHRGGLRGPPWERGETRSAIFLRVRATKIVDFSLLRILHLTESKVLRLRAEVSASPTRPRIQSSGPTAGTAAMEPSHRLDPNSLSTDLSARFSLRRRSTSKPSIILCQALNHILGGAEKIERHQDLLRHTPRAEPIRTSPTEAFSNGNATRSLWTLVHRNGLRRTLSARRLWSDCHALCSILDQFSVTVLPGKSPAPLSSRFISPPWPRWHSSPFSPERTSCIRGIEPLLRLVPWNGRSTSRGWCLSRSLWPRRSG